MDDIILIGDDSKEITTLKRRIIQRVWDQESWETSLAWMLLAQGKELLFVFPRKYVLNLPEETRMTDCGPVNTPIGPHQKLGKIEQGLLVNASRC